MHCSEEIDELIEAAEKLFKYFRVCTFVGLGHSSQVITADSEKLLFCFNCLFLLSTPVLQEAFWRSVKLLYKTPKVK